MQEWAIALASLVGGGGLVELARALLGRRSQKVDNLAKLEQIATSMAEKATAAADKRVEDVERKVAELTERDARRLVLAAAHRQWDEQLVAQLGDLGVTVPPPPPLEVM